MVIKIQRWKNLISSYTVLAERVGYFAFSYSLTPAKNWYFVMFNKSSKFWSIINSKICSSNWAKQNIQLFLPLLYNYVGPCLESKMELTNISIHYVSTMYYCEQMHIYYTSMNTKYLALDIGFQIKAQRSNTKTDNLHPEKV